MNRARLGRGITSSPISHAPVPVSPPPPAIFFLSTIWEPWTGYPACCPIVRINPGFGRFIHTPPTWIACILLGKGYVCVCVCVCVCVWGGGGGMGGRAHRVQYGTYSTYPPPPGLSSAPREEWVDQCTNTQIDPVVLPIRTTATNYTHLQLANFQRTPG